MGAPTAGVHVAQQEPLWRWYKTNSDASASVATNAAKKTMQAGVDARCTASSATTDKTSSGTATPAPSSLIRSYSDFGHLYSRETSGKTWPEIMKIDSLVRESQTGLGGSVVVKKLNNWYRHQATAAEKKDFDDNAVAHMKQGAVM